MILQSLCEQYRLLSKKEDNDLPKTGCTLAKISFGLCIDESGELVGIRDLRKPKGNKYVPVEKSVPVQNPRSGKNPPPYFLSDKTKYVLGWQSPDAGESFCALHWSLLGEEHPISLFLKKWKPELLESNEILQPFVDDIKKGVNFVFYLEDEYRYAHEDESLLEAYQEYLSSLSEESIGRCLVTGKMTELCRLHDKIKGAGGNAAGTVLVSFKDFESYGKEQGSNAPIGKETMTQYVDALNYMLRDPNYHSRLNDMTFVYWANRPGTYMDFMKGLFPDKEDKEEHLEYRNLARDLIRNLNMGLPLKHREYELDPDANIFILGLAPNNARLAVAFWQVNTFEIFLRRIGDHYDNLEIVDGYDEVPIWRILSETMPVKKEKTASSDQDKKKWDEKKKDEKKGKPSPVMAKSLVSSIFTGGMYPISLYQGILGRIRADGDINPVRAGMIKAYFMRKSKIMKTEEEITVALNENDSHVSYQLGRLFAVLEMMQKKSADNQINSTIKDRYFTSASTSPLTVFPQLIKLSQHHSAKLKNSGYWESLKADILDKVGSVFPSCLNLEEQGRFILGYYQQNKFFYTKKEDKE